MEVVEFIQKQFTSVWRQYDGVMQETTEEQINWAPPGTANSIGVTLVHMISGLDNNFQTILQDKPKLWESEGWGEKLALSGPPGRVHGWDEVKSKHLALEPILGYAAAVRAAVDACLPLLTAAELDRMVTLYNSERPVADMLVMQISHLLGHTGEIAALKGMQGVKGLPF
jgi:hypothetical protein